MSVLTAMAVRVLSMLTGAYGFMTAVRAVHVWIPAVPRIGYLGALGVVVGAQLVVTAFRPLPAPDHGKR